MNPPHSIPSPGLTAGPKLLLVACLLQLGASCRGPAPAADAIDAREEAAQASAKVANTTEADVKPGINDRFLDPDLEVGQLVETFEGESREIFSSRTRIARACGFAPGQHVADIGAGTGLFTFLFAQDVGADGKVYAVDISDKLVQFIGGRASERGLSQVQPVLGTIREVGLAPASVDGAFVCDTYHHFNYPMTTLASLKDAIRPGGSLLVIEFERIPGVSREWTLGHVRAGKEVFRSEIEAAGFEFVEELQVEGLEENYFLRFRRP